MPQRGDVPGARLSKNNITNGSLQLQQPIVCNYAVHPQMGSWRQDNLENKDIPRERLFTTVLGNGRGDEYALLHIQPLDLLFSFKDQGKCQPLDVMRESKTKVFSVWNAAEIPKSITTQEEYEDLYGFRGFAAKPFMFGKSWQPDMGVAGYVAGSKGFYNRGWSEFYPGDKAAWSLPSINPVLREEQRELLPSDVEHPKLRDAAIVNRLTYEDSHQFIQKELTQSFSDNVGKEYLWSVTMPQSNTYVSDNRRVAIALRNFVCWSAVAAISVLQSYGMVTINSPSSSPAISNSFSDPLDPAIYNRNRAVEDRALREVIQQKHEYDINTGTISHRGPLSAIEFNTRANNLIWLASKLGQMPLVSQRIHPAYNVINAICGVGLKSLLMDPGLHKAFDIERFFPKTMRDGASIIGNSRLDLSRQYNTSRPVGSLKYAQDSISKKTFHAFGQAIARVESHTVGIVMSNSRPGEWTDAYW